MTGGTYTNTTGLLLLGAGSGNAGRLTTVANSTAATLSGAISFRGNNTFDIAAGSVPDGRDCVISGAIFNDAGSGGFTKTGDGKLVLSGANTYNGTTTISAGTLQIGDGGASGTLGTGAVSNNAALAFNRSGTYTCGNAISGIGSVTQAGPGLTVLAGANTYVGGSFINAGECNSMPAHCLREACGSMPAARWPPRHQRHGGRLARQRPDRHGLHRSGGRGWRRFGSHRLRAYPAYAALVWGPSATQPTTAPH